MQSFRLAKSGEDTSNQPRSVSLKATLLVLVSLVVFGLYFSGRMDPMLSNVGLNYHDCAKNGFGATFCGDDLTEYRARIAGLTTPTP